MSSASSATNKVKAYAASAVGVPFESSEIVRRDVRDHDVSIKILFCGICHTDIHMWRDDWGWSNFPLVPGHEIVGVVEAVGPKVTNFNVGQKVGVGTISDTCQTCDHCATDLEPHCRQGMTMTYASPDKISGGFTFGGYSERIVVEDRYVLNIPEGLSLEEAAPLLCAGITVYTPMKSSHLGPGKTIGVVGIGGLGHIALKIARALNANVVAFTSSASKKDELLSLGAHHVVVTSDPESFKEWDSKIDLIIDTVSASHDVTPYINTLAFNGEYNLIGIPVEPVGIPALPLMMKHLKVTGTAVGGLKATQEMLDLCAAHKIGAQVEVVPLAEVNKALERLEKGDVRYRFVLDVQSAFSQN